MSARRLQEIAETTLSFWVVFVLSGSAIYLIWGDDWRPFLTAIVVGMALWVYAGGAKLAADAEAKK